MAAWKPASGEDYTDSRGFQILVPTTYLLAHLAEVVLNAKTNVKVLEAALDLIAAMVKDEGSLAGDLCFFCKDDSDLRALRNPASTIKEITRASAAIQGSNLPKLLHLFQTGQSPVQIAAAGW